MFTRNKFDLFTTFSLPRAFLQRYGVVSQCY